MTTTSRGKSCHKILCELGALRISSGVNQTIYATKCPDRLPSREASSRLPSSGSTSTRAMRASTTSLQACRQRAERQNEGGIVGARALLKLCFQWHNAGMTHLYECSPDSEGLKKPCPRGGRFLAGCLSTGRSVAIQGAFWCRSR